VTSVAEVRLVINNQYSESPPRWCSLEIILYTYQHILYPVFVSNRSMIPQRLVIGQPSLHLTSPHVLVLVPRIYDLGRLLAVAWQNLAKLLWKQKAQLSVQTTS
jgi:hypothetical protein